MRTLSKEEFLMQKMPLQDEIRKGAVFVYPTDTIYGIGCNAENEEAVQKIRELKSRPEAPFSVIAPSKQWIREHCVVTGEAEEWLEKLPGPYTLVLRLKRKAVAHGVAPGKETLGVRMPDNWFLDAVMDLGLPVVTTSVNKSGEQYMTSLDDLDDEMKYGISFAVDVGARTGRPSKIVDLSDNIKIIER